MPSIILPVALALGAGAGIAWGASKLVQAQKRGTSPLAPEASTLRAAKVYAVDMVVSHAGPFTNVPSSDPNVVVGKTEILATSIKAALAAMGFLVTSEPIPKEFGVGAGANLAKSEPEALIRLAKIFEKNDSMWVVQAQWAGVDGAPLPAVVAPIVSAGYFQLPVA